MEKLKLSESEAQKARIIVDVFRPPFVKGGFRSGEWSVSVNGIDCKVYSSVSAYCDFPEMEEHVRESTLKNLTQNGITVKGE
jgi:hypothetical protein